MRPAPVWLALAALACSPRDRPTPEPPPRATADASARSPDTGAQRRAEPPAPPTPPAAPARPDACQTDGDCIQQGVCWPSEPRCVLRATYAQPHCGAEAQRMLRGWAAPVFVCHCTAGACVAEVIGKNKPQAE